MRLDPQFRGRSALRERTPTIPVVVRQPSTPSSAPQRHRNKFCRWSDNVEITPAQSCPAQTACRCSGLCAPAQNCEVESKLGAP